MMPTPFTIRLVLARQLTDKVRELVFEREDGPLVFDPGQWVQLILPGTPELRRSYSIASPPDGSPRFEIAVTHVIGGEGSTRLHALTIGQTLHALGPSGFFTRPPGAGVPSLFVATGTGFTPLRSMLLAALAAHAAEPLWVLFGVRNEADLLYQDELAALVAGHPNVRVELTLSRPSAEYTGRHGYVQTHVPELLGQMPAGSHVFVCGLERMVKAVRDVARKELGLPRDRVHSERYD